MDNVVSMLTNIEVIIASFVDPMTTVGRIVSILEVQSTTPVRTREYSRLPRKKAAKAASQVAQTTFVAIC